MIPPEGREKLVKRDNIVNNDELRSEYDLKDLKVKKVGPDRKSFYGPTVRMDADVAEVFPNSKSVNEALRFLIRITQENKSALLASTNMPNK